MFGRKNRVSARYNFTEAVRRALHAAHREAVRLKHDAVGPEHILLALLADETVTGILRDLHVSQPDLRASLEERIPPGKVERNSAEMPYTARAKKVLEWAIAEAREHNDPHVGTEHLLPALIREEEGSSSTLLRDHGLSLERVRGRAAPDGVRDAHFRLRIDDASDLSIYEQIVAQVTEAVATGALSAGDRLPTVRQLADELDVAPGTVARAYSELERQSVVITEGARGTRVAQPSSAAVDEPQRWDTLVGLLRPVAVAAFHLGADASELRTALDEAMRGIFDQRGNAA
jgi:DNA-binding transcriptional regulator YhcF (GntR family)